MKTGNMSIKLIVGACAMAVLILDAETALHGASAGIDLCIRSVIPALFPFLICTSYLTGNLSGIPLAFLRPIGELCRIPASSAGIMITGLLGGYPTGAQATAQAWELGTIPKEDARRMLGFFSNAGPAFIFGILSPYFSGIGPLFLLWGVHILSAVAVGFLLPGGHTTDTTIQRPSGISFSQAVSRSVRTMGLICGWIILFRMTILFLERWILWSIPRATGIWITGLLELTNGCVSLSVIDDEPLRFLLASTFLSAGGLCVGMQTISVTGSLGPGMYFPGKVMQCCISTLLCGFIIPMIYPGTWFLLPSAIALIILVILLYCLHFRKNNSSNFHLQGV